MHPQFQSVLAAPGNSQQLDAITELLRVRQVGGVQIGDAFHVHLVKGDGRAKGIGRQQRQLVPGVDAVDIQAWVGLGKALGLSVLQGGGKAQPFAAHLRQDEVAGAVDDARHPFNAVGHQALA